MTVTADAVGCETPTQSGVATIIATGWNATGVMQRPAAVFRHRAKCNTSNEATSRVMSTTSYAYASQT